MATLTRRSPYSAVPGMSQPASVNPTVGNWQFLSNSDIMPYYGRPAVSGSGVYDNDESFGLLAPLYGAAIRASQSMLPQANSNLPGRFVTTGTHGSVGINAGVDFELPFKQATFGTPQYFRKLADDQRAWAPSDPGFRSVVEHLNYSMPQGTYSAPRNTYSPEPFAVQSLRSQGVSYGGITTTQSRVLAPLSGEAQVGRDFYTGALISAESERPNHIPMFRPNESLNISSSGYSIVSPRYTSVSTGSFRPTSRTYSPYLGWR